FTLSFIGADSQLVLEDILVGDLWLCAGQSNMQFTLDMLGESNTEVSPQAYSNLRLFTVGVTVDYLPKRDLGGGSWNRTTPESIKNFSATAYYFGKDLVEKQQVPIGLISSNLGATAIETWMSIDALKAFPQFDAVTDKILGTNKDFETIDRELEAFRKDWDGEYYLKGIGLSEGWYRDDYDDSDWKECANGSFWEEQGFCEHDGSFWYRRKFDLQADQLEYDYQLVLNQIDDYDITWVNGVKVGESFGCSNFRNYTVPKEILREKGNSIAIRVFDIGGKGGLYTSPFWGNPVLNGSWKAKKGTAIDPETFPIPTVVNGSIFSHPALLYNGSIAPLELFPITGVIWYQGESNENRAVEYQFLLEAMIKDWRMNWNNPKMPFLIVQLANYRAEDTLPGDSKWAEIRESQFKAVALPYTDLVTAVDIGDAMDIHPKNKADVGKRLSALAMYYSYGMPYTNGPKFSSQKIRGNKVHLKLNTYGSALKSLNKYGYIRGFAVAGSDGKFVWAKAFVASNDEVVVYSDSVARPKFVRYAWSDNPGSLDLVNTEGLPVFPFRTDTLGLSTADIKYSYDPHSF
ncbi:MAG TPA: sialate O-acetylesterase, partial [Arenibacter sp.]|nr:sialate O-acetylesterase [Arenibacter sp.]